MRLWLRLQPVSAVKYLIHIALQEQFRTVDYWFFWRINTQLCVYSRSFYSARFLQSFGAMKEWRTMSSAYWYRIDIDYFGFWGSVLFFTKEAQTISTIYMWLFDKWVNSLPVQPVCPGHFPNGLERNYPHWLCSKPVSVTLPRPSEPHPVHQHFLMKEAGGSFVLPVIPVTMT